MNEELKLLIIKVCSDFGIPLEVRESALALKPEVLNRIGGIVDRAIPLTEEDIREVTLWGVSFEKSRFEELRGLCNSSGD